MSTITCLKSRFSKSKVLGCHKFCNVGSWNGFTFPLIVFSISSRIVGFCRFTPTKNIALKQIPGFRQTIIYSAKTILSGQSVYFLVHLNEKGNKITGCHLSTCKITVELKKKIKSLEFLVRILNLL